MCLVYKVLVMFSLKLFAKQGFICSSLFCMLISDTRKQGTSCNDGEDSWPFALVNVLEIKVCSYSLIYANDRSHYARSFDCLANSPQLDSLVVAMSTLKLQHCYLFCLYVFTFDAFFGTFIAINAFIFQENEVFLQRQVGLGCKKQ